MSAEDSDAVSRRGFLRTAAGTAAVAGAAGAGAGTAAAQSGKTVKVGPGGNLVFEPAKVYVKPGTKVTWKWESDGHNIVPGDVPGGANWQGTGGGPTKLYDTGHTYEHTFETKGTYNYWCQPHKTAGMIGDVIVNDSGAAPTPSGGGGGPPPIPDSARTLGLATGFGMLSTLGLAYFFMKYGGDYGDEEA